VAVAHGGRLEIEAPAAGGLVVRIDLPELPPVTVTAVPKRTTRVLTQS
jgi:hypothetical protein